MMKIPRTGRITARATTDGEKLPGDSAERESTCDHPLRASPMPGPHFEWQVSRAHPNSLCHLKRHLKPRWWGSLLLSATQSPADWGMTLKWDVYLSGLVSMTLPEANESYSAIWTSLMVQWLRILLPMQRTQVRSLFQEDPTGHRTAKPVHHSYWANTQKPLKPTCSSLSSATTKATTAKSPSTKTREQPLPTITRESCFRAKKDCGLGSQMGRSHGPLPISFVFSLWPPYLTLLLPLSLTKS